MPTTDIDFSKLKMLHNKVLILKDKPKQTTDKGIFIPDTDNSNKRAKSGLIVSMGPGHHTSTGVFIPMESHGFKIGDRVRFSPFQGKEVGDEHLVLEVHELFTAEEAKFIDSVEKGITDIKMGRGTVLPADVRPSDPLVPA